MGYDLSGCSIINDFGALEIQVEDMQNDTNKTEKALVTVVIPVYNVEKYLDRCINSVVNQTYTNLEIILVDDGSPDRCPEMCDAWAKRDARIKVVHKKNEGLGYARNTGIDHASGEYICFVDSDDYIALDLVEKTYAAAKEKNVDIVLYGFFKVDQAGKICGEVCPKPDKCYYEGGEILSYVLPNMLAKSKTNFFMSMSGGLFSFDLIKKTGWRMVSERDIISEDWFSLMILYRYVKNVAFIREALYYYCENPKSLTHTYRYDRYEKVKYFYDASIAKCKELGYSNAIRSAVFEAYISSVIASLKSIVVSDQSRRDTWSAFKQIIDDEHLQRALKDADLKKEYLQRRILCTAMKKKWYAACYIMVKAKTI